MDEDAAAVKMQSLKRAKAARQETHQKRDYMQQKKAEQEQLKQNKASETLSAGAKGYQQRRAAKLREQEMAKGAVRVQAMFKGRKERADPAAEANIRRERSKNDPQVQASAYLKEHKIMELFEMLGQMLVSEKPEDPRGYLVEQLERINAVKDRTSPLNFFSDEDIDTLFNMYDVSKSGITPSQCREALDAIGLYDVAVPESSLIDLALFKSLVPKAL